MSKNPRKVLSVHLGKQRRWEKEEAKEVIRELARMHLGHVGSVKTPLMSFVKMEAYRAHTQRVYAIVHDDAQEVWVDLFSVSKDGKTFFAATNAPGPLIGLAAQRPTYFASQRFAKAPVTKLYREFLRLRPKGEWKEASDENLGDAYRIVCEADSKWQEQNLAGADSEEKMQQVVKQSYAAARALRKSDPVDELRSLFRGLRQERQKLPESLTGAAVAGDLEMVKLFLKEGADINQKSVGFSSPLAAAASRGNLNVIEYLLEEGADPAQADFAMFSPIANAAAHGYGLIVKRLLKEKLPADQKKSALERANEKKHTGIVSLLKGRTVPVEELMRSSPAEDKSSFAEVMEETSLLMGKEPEEEAISGQGKENAEKRVLELLRNESVKAKLDYSFREVGAYLQMAVETGNSELVKAVLAAGPSAQTISGSLTAAAAAGNLKMIELILKAGADPNHRGWIGNTALISAARSGSPQAVQRLLEAGADPKARTQGGETAITAATGPFEKRIREILQAAAKPRAKDEGSIKMRGKRKGNPAGATGCNEFRDAMYQGHPEWSLLCVEAPCEAVASAFAKLHSKAKWLADTADKMITGERQMVFVLQLKGQPWTILLRTVGWLQMTDIEELPKDARDLSAQLKTRSITYMAEDTSGCEGYEIFDKGKPIETAESGDVARFKSTWRKKPKFGNNFPEPTFSDLGIYLPECWIDNDGYDYKLVLGGIPPEAVERLDCFELAK